MENIVQCNIEKGDIMAHKTFISYKWSEAQQLRDDIIDALGEDASYYKGETSDSPDLTDTTTDNIKKNLRDSFQYSSLRNTPATACRCLILY